MAHGVTSKSNSELKILKALLEYDAEGLTRRRVASIIAESDLGKVISDLENLKQREFVSETFSMVLDDTDPDEVAIWFITDSGTDYLKQNGFA